MIKFKSYDPKNDVLSVSLSKTDFYYADKENLQVDGLQKIIDEKDGHTLIFSLAEVEDIKIFLEGIKEELPNVKIGYSAFQAETIAKIAAAKKTGKLVEAAGTEVEVSPKAESAVAPYYHASPAIVVRL